MVRHNEACSSVNYFIKYYSLERQHIMISDKVIKWWHIIQTAYLAINSLILIIICFAVPLPKTEKSSGIILCSLALVLILLQFTVLLTKNADSWWAQLNFLFESWTATIFLSLFMAILSSLKNNNFLTLLCNIYSIIMYIPITKLALCRIRNNWLRILSIIFLFPQVIGIPEYFVTHADSWLKVLDKSDIIGVFSFVLIITIAMHSWGFGLAKFKINQKISLGVLALILIFMLCDCFLNAFNSSNSWLNFLTSWSFKVNYFNWKMVLLGIGTGISEEFLFRFVILNLFLVIFRKYKNQVVWGVLVSGLIFGLTHFINLGEQTLSATSIQALSAIFSGFLFAAIYLYTDSLLIPILYHSLLDTLAFIVTGTTTTLSPNMYDWQVTIFLMILYTLLVIFLLSGKRREVVESNVKRVNLIN